MFLFKLHNKKSAGENGEIVGSKNIVSGKKYSTDTEIGADLYNHVNEGIKDKQKTGLEIIEEHRN